MKTGVLKTLEVDKILRALESFALTAGGAFLARSLEPSTDPRRVREMLRETSEARRLLDKDKQIRLAGTPDIRLHLEALAIEDRSLDVVALLQLAHVTETASAAKAVIESERSELPLLSALAGRLPDLSSLRSVIEKAIDPGTAEVRDDASPELRSLRARLFKLRQRLRNMLESYFNQKDSRKLLQDQVITVRNGRSVLPVKAEFRGQLMGIVHGSSASGATLFIEPISTVEINNDIVALEEEERQEVERILAALTAEARLKLPELTEAATVLAMLDLIQAKAFFAESYQGAEPEIVEAPCLRLKDARHPLLLAKVTERIGEPRPSREAVPLSFTVDDKVSALVFTGPNTGGKTVALKTAGLLSLMAQSGLHVPAAPSSGFSTFKQVFADIGDEQSIGSSLSTFSYHLQNVVEVERELESPSLVLLDEVGTGTDPAEGGALGTALVEHFRKRGALVLASTHHGMLKAYATTTPGVRAASFEFDAETYAPTYRLAEGATGRSLAFEMALRLGLPREVVQNARALQDQKERQAQQMLDQLDAEGKALARERQRLHDERRVLEESHRREKEHDLEASRQRETHLEAFRRELEAEMATARVRLKEILGEARERSEGAAGLAHAVSEASRAVTEAGQKLDELPAAVAGHATEPAPRPHAEVHRGDRVTISGLGLTGVVSEIFSSDEAEVMVRDKKLRIPISELEPAEPARSQPTSPPRPMGTPSVTKHAPSELNVIGCTVEQALSQADKFLDDAFLSEHKVVRLIHGHGQGILKRAIAEWLASHPHVASHQPEGSGAVTVVELKV